MRYYVLMITSISGEVLACDIRLTSDPGLLARILRTPDTGTIRKLFFQAGFVVADGGPATYSGFNERFFERSESLYERGEIGDYCVLIHGLFVERFEKPKTKASRRRS